MKKDPSYLLYDKYFELENNVISIVLHSNITLKGQIIGYYFGEPDESFIVKWHFCQDEIMHDLGLETLGDSQGVFILTDEIREVCFEQDKSVLVF